MQEIDLYQKIDKNYTKLAGIEYRKPELSYYDPVEEDERNIDFEADHTNVIELNKYESTWNPVGNDLKYVQKFTISNPSQLFGKDKITDENNAIGIAAHIYSRTAKFQETLALNDVVTNEDTKKEIIFQKRFDKSQLRGVIEIEFFFYLKKLTRENPYQANEIGMRLSQTEIFRTSIIIDGDGSTFPITETDNPGGPLWIIRKEWSDPATDAFDVINVQVELNRKHKVFRSLVQAKGPTTQEFMSNIVNQAMAMIIYQAVSDMNAQEENWDFGLAEEGSILNIVKYWVEIFEIDINASIMEIFSKIQSYKENSEEK